MFCFSVGPKIKPFVFPSDLEEGMRSVVVCAVLSGDPPITIHWLKDGSEIPLDLDAKIDQIDDFTSILNFRSAGPHHNGNYTCVARNPATMVNHTATMVVNGKLEELVHKRSLYVLTKEEYFTFIMFQYIQMHILVTVNV